MCWMAQHDEVQTEVSRYRCPYSGLLAVVPFQEVVRWEQYAASPSRGGYLGQFASPIIFRPDALLAAEAGIHGVSQLTR